MGAAHRVVLASLVGALALAGCTAQGGEKKVMDDDGGPGPLGSIAMAVTEVSDAELKARIVAAEEAVAACMRELGFEYVPAPENYGFTSTEDAEGPEPGSLEFAEEHGYGIARGPGISLAAGPDPNEEIRAGLSPEALEEYERAYLGDPESWGEQPPPVEEQGCSGKGAASVFGEEPDPFDAEVRAELERIEIELVPNDPRVRKLDGTWAACMAEAGYPGLSSPASAEEELFEEFLTSGAGAGAVDADGLTAAAREFLEKEIAQATADWHCRAELGYDAVVRAVRNAFEQKFVDAHRAELDAWAARKSDPSGS